MIFKIFNFFIFSSLLFFVATGPVYASEDILDQYPKSPLYQKPVEVIPGVFLQLGQPHRLLMKTQDITII